MLNLNKYEALYPLENTHNYQIFLTKRGEAYDKTLFISMTIDEAIEKVNKLHQAFFVLFSLDDDLESDVNVLSELNHYIKSKLTNSPIEF